MVLLHVMARLVRAIHDFLILSEIQRLTEVIPPGIDRMDEPHFPRAWPFLDTRFPRYRAFDFFVPLHENQSLQPIAFGEALICSAAVFRSAPTNIRRHAEIERSVCFVCDDIDPAAFHLLMMLGVVIKGKTWMARTGRAMTDLGGLVQQLRGVSVQRAQNGKMCRAGL